MGNSIEKPVNVIVIPFLMKENEKNKDMMEVPPKAKEYKMEIGVEPENQMEITICDGGTYTKNGNIISFTENGLRKSGKLITTEDLERKRKETSIQKASGYSIGE